MSLFPRPLYFLLTHWNQYIWLVQHSRTKKRDAKGKWITLIDNTPQLRPMYLQNHENACIAHNYITGINGIKNPLNYIIHNSVLNNPLIYIDQMFLVSPTALRLSTLVNKVLHLDHHTINYSR